MALPVAGASALTLVQKMKTFRFSALITLIAFAAIGIIDADDRRSQPEAKIKYELAITYLGKNAPNWAVKESFDVVNRYPDSHEATRAAMLILTNLDHISPLDFYFITGVQLPDSGELPDKTMNDLLMKGFVRAGALPPAKK